MPIHDWTRVDAGLFHDFHQSWTVALCNSLNIGTLPADYFALVEQSIRGPIPDVLTLRLCSDSDRGDDPGLRAEVDSYLRKANRVTVRHRHGDVVAVIEIVSPGNKASRAEFRTLVEKSAELIRQGIHLLVIDLFPPGKRDPQGIHKAIWDEFQEDENFELPPETPLTLASYDAGPECVAYVEFIGVGDCLPEMPLFLRPGVYVPGPLEETYQTAWSNFPAALKGLLEKPA
jgi:hypothetical protein